jgi:hypothetical protein
MITCQFKVMIRQHGGVQSTDFMPTRVTSVRAFIPRLGSIFEEAPSYAKTTYVSKMLKQCRPLTVLRHL